MSNIDGESGNNNSVPSQRQVFNLNELGGSGSGSNSNEGGNPLGLTAVAYNDLKRSGISDAFIRKMRIRQLINVGTDGKPDDYCIPYFKITGELLPEYYRQRIFRLASAATPKPPKYIQALDSGPTRVYFPPNWQDELRFKPYLVITEGEKKCASAAQYGIPCIGLGGIDNWVTKRIEVDRELLKPIAKAEHESRVTKVSLEITEELAEQLYKGGIDNKQVAPEFLDLVQEAARLEKTIYICYDTDKLKDSRDEHGNPKFGTKLEVNRAAFDLSMWLIDQGVSDIQFVQLPAVVPPNSRDGKPDKTGVDDFIVAKGPEEFLNYVLNGKHTFPTLGNVRYFANKVLNQPRVKRRDYIKVARAIVADLDRHGQRYTANSDVHYYFEYATKSMMQLSLSAQEMRDLRLTDFGKMLFDRYGLSSRDESALKELGDQFVNSRGIKHIEARRVSYAANDSLYYQLDDGTLLKASAKTGVTIHENGYDDVLFVRNLVEPIALDQEGLSNQLSQEKNRTMVQLKAQTNRWLEAFRTMQIQPMEGMTLEETHMLLSAHFFLNPWFRRWNNLMLPMELTIAEPGSGKSLFYMLRKYILTGRTTLNRLPQDIRDWYANITDSDGMWVADNVGKVPTAIKHTFSDELARLITDLDPAVSMRRLYTTADDQRMTVPCTFAITAINNPFTNEDIIQRSLMINMKAIPRGERDGEWLNKQINEAEGGRAAWVLHHMLISVRFLILSGSKWDNQYKSRHRLMNYEQSLYLMGLALNFDAAKMKQVIAKLSGSIQSTIAKNNPVIEGLHAFAASRAANPIQGDKPFFSQDIVDWALVSEEFSDIQVLTNSRALGRYIHAHQYDINESAGIFVAGKRDGKVSYRVDVDFHTQEDEK